MLMLFLLVASLALLFGTGECYAARRIGFCIALFVLGYWAVHIVELIAGTVPSAAFGNAMQHCVKIFDAAVVWIGNAIAYVVKCVVCIVFMFFFMLVYGYICLFSRK